MSSKQKVALEVISEDMTLAELSKKYDVHATQISRWKRAAIEKMVSAFGRRGHNPHMPSTADIEKFCIRRLGSSLWNGIFWLMPRFNSSDRDAKMVIKDHNVNV